MLGTERPVNHKLSIELLGEAKFKGGERKTVTFHRLPGNDRKVVIPAKVMVKILGSSFRPLIFHASTDENGLAKVNLQLPNFNSGRAALLAAPSMLDGSGITSCITHGRRQDRDKIRDKAKICISPSVERESHRMNITVNGEIKELEKPVSSIGYSSSFHCRHSGSRSS
jgi:hypothetical protein